MSDCGVLVYQPEPVNNRNRNILSLKLEHSFHAGLVTCEVYRVYPREGKNNAIFYGEDVDKFGELLDFYIWLHEKDGHPDLLLDFSRVKGFVTSRLIGKLLNAHNRIAKDTGKDPSKAHIHIAGGSPGLRSILKISKVERYFIFHDSVPEYRDSMRDYCGEITQKKYMLHSRNCHCGNGKGNLLALAA